MTTRNVSNTSEITGYGEMTEADLLAAAKRGCEPAYDELMRRTQGLCLRVASRLLRDEDDAADQVQDAFWKAYVNLQTFEQQSKFSTWVTRIVINCCIMKLRSEKLKTVSFDSIIEKRRERGAAMASATYLDSPEKRLARKELRDLVRRELSMLPVILRQPLEYYYLEDVSLDQMAFRLGISISAAKSRLCRGQQYLRKRLDPLVTRQRAAPLAA